MKKLIALLLAVVMMASVAVAYAADGPAYSITAGDTTTTKIEDDTFSVAVTDEQTGEVFTLEVSQKDQDDENIQAEFAAVQAVRAKEGKTDVDTLKVGTASAIETAIAEKIKAEAKKAAEEAAAQAVEAAKQEAEDAARQAGLSEDEVKAAVADAEKAAAAEQQAVVDAAVAEAEATAEEVQATKVALKVTSVAKASTSNVKLAKDVAELAARNAAQAKKAADVAAAKKAAEDAAAQAVEAAKKAAEDTARAIEGVTEEQVQAAIAAAETKAAEEQQAIVDAAVEEAEAAPLVIEKITVVRVTVQFKEKYAKEAKVFPVLKLPVLDSEGKPVMQAKLDLDGNPVLDENGEPVMENVTEEILLDGEVQEDGSVKIDFPIDVLEKMENAKNLLGEEKTILSVLSDMETDQPAPAEEPAAEETPAA